MKITVVWICKTCGRYRNPHTGICHHCFNQPIPSKKDGQP